MSAILQLEVTRDATGDLIAPSSAEGPKRAVRRILNHIEGGLNGSKGISSVKVRNNAAASTGTFTLVSCATGTVLAVNGVDFIATNGAGLVANNEFDASGSDTQDAAALAAAINASTNAAVSGIVTATSALGVVTVTAVGGGYGGNAVTLETKGILASGTITPATAVATNTVTLNGVALTARQEMARATITLATAVVGNLVVINGYTLTGIAGTATATEFQVGVTDTADAVSLAAVINAHAVLSTQMTASSALGVVSLRAKASGTAANAYTLTKTGSPISLSAATFSGGQATSATTFDYGDTNAQTCTEVTRAINAATNALISGQVTAVCSATVVTVRAKLAGLRGNAVTLASSGSTLAVSGARLTGGTVLSSTGTQATGTFTCVSGSGTMTAIINGVSVAISHGASDAADGIALAAAINSSTNALVRGFVTAADDGAGVVTTTAVHGGVAGNVITTTATGTGLTAGQARLATGAAPTTVVPSAARLASGSSDAAITYSF